MNLLPFVFIILALFATLSSSLLIKGRSIALIQKGYHSYMDAERSAKTAYIQSAYAKIPVPKKTATESKPHDPKPVKNWRKQSGKQSRSRLNLYAFLHFEDSPPHLAQTFWTLMDELYANLPAYVELKKKGRLADFFEKWKKCDHFTDITYEDPDFAFLFYKMSKGCICYDTEAKIGYPPLEDFIYINRASANIPMPWRLARPPLLRAYFGKLASTILDLEAENPTSQATLSRDELDKLLQFYPDIPKHLLNDAVGNTSDATVIGSSDLTEVHHKAKK